MLFLVLISLLNTVSLSTSRAPVAIPELDDFICSLTTSCPIDAIFPPTLNVIDLSANCKVETETILQLQLDDPVFGSILRQLSVNPRQRPDLPETASRDAKRLRDQFRHIVKRSGVWHLCARNGQRLLILPSFLRAEVMYHFHSASIAAHLGLYATLSRIRSSFFWPSMGNQVRRFVLSCESCCKAKAQSIRTRAPLSPIETTSPFEMVGCDILDLPHWAFTPSGEWMLPNSKLPNTCKGVFILLTGWTPNAETSNGFNAVLVVTDLFTKWCEAYPLRQSTAEEVFTHLHRLRLKIRHAECYSYRSRLSIWIQSSRCAVWTSWYPQVSCIHVN